MADGVEIQGSGSPERVAYDLYRYLIGLVPEKADAKARLEQHLRLFNTCRVVARGRGLPDVSDLF
jgi:hypothetical protein